MSAGLPHTFQELGADIRQLTFQLPLGIDHVHCYFVRGASGAWIVVDTAVAYPGAEAVWREAIARLDAPVGHIFVTHYHPDHVGGADLVHELTGAPVIEGDRDFQACLAAWAPPTRTHRFAGLLDAHGFDPAIAAAAQAADELLAPNIRYHPNPTLTREGESVDGWEVLHLPGHAAGHLVLIREGVMISGDVLLNRITPNVSRDAQSGDDPLARYFETLERIAMLAPTRAYPGHGSVIDDPARRATEIRLHHDERLAVTRGTLDAGPMTAYEASFLVFAQDLPPTLRRFAFLETLAHLEYLANRGKIVRVESTGHPVVYRNL
ncbi:MAG: MBL fold metallo-hydrolase [Actinobacteria bacterium]|uniref:Unannotated protein n=1 Tax=freshwater metagenome TaxID=449393 RepID=A0A6J6PED9_9ZZZZ|nr:MBL fold metallo-hydrolase [Actinomycetota bacterium]